VNDDIVGTDLSFTEFYELVKKLEEGSTSTWEFMRPRKDDPEAQAEVQAEAQAEVCYIRTNHVVLSILTQSSLYCHESRRRISHK
jgi:hypothetical protein